MLLYSPIYFYRKNPTFIDYKGYIAAVFFTSGCNFRCGFCHNASLIPRVDGIRWESIANACCHFKNNWVDAAVVTGGEPTIHEDLPKLISLFQKAAFKIKIDTNGSRPDMLKKIYRNIDYIAMDVKCDLKNYKNIAKYNDTENISKSIEILMNGDKEYEFRTTIIESVHTEDEMRKMGELLKGCKQWVLQPFVPRDDLPDPTFIQMPKTSDAYLEKVKSWLPDINVSFRSQNT